MSAVRCFSTVLFAATLSACSAASDPATEAPVTLPDGEYQVAISGQATGMLGTRSTAPDDKPTKICLTASDDADKVAKLARTYYGFSGSCSHDGNERVGNQVSGEVSCAADPERAPGGSIGFAYTGQLTADAIRLEAKWRYNLDTAVMRPEEREILERGRSELEKLSLVVEAKRIGDCATQSWQ